MNFTIPILKEKIKNANYEGKLTGKNKAELVKIFHELYPLEGDNKSEDIESDTKNLSIMTVDQLKKELVDLGYKGRRTNIKKSEIIELILKLRKDNQKNISQSNDKNDKDDKDDGGKHHEKCGFQYRTISINSNEMLFSKLAKTLNISLSQLLPKTDTNINTMSLEDIFKYLTFEKSIECVHMNLNTSTNICTFNCTSKDASHNKQFLFFLTKDGDNTTYELVKFQPQYLLLNKDQIPTRIYHKLLKCLSSILSSPNTTLPSRQACDGFLEQMGMSLESISIPGEGNCFYELIAIALGLKNHQEVRQKFAEALTPNRWKKIKRVLEESEIESKKLYSRQDYIDKVILQDGEWVSDEGLAILFPKAFPNVSLVIFTQNNGQCNLVCQLIKRYKSTFIFAKYKSGLHYDLYKINGKLTLTWNEIPEKLQTYIENICHDIDYRTPASSPNESDDEPVQQPAPKESFETKTNIETNIETNVETNFPKWSREKFRRFQEKFDDRGAYRNAIKAELAKRNIKISPSDDYGGYYLRLFEKLCVEGEFDEPPLKVGATVDELVKRLWRKGITDRINTRSRDDVVGMEEACRCYPLEGKWCTDDMYCDIMNNICISKDKIPKSNKIAIESFDNHKYVGTEKAVYKSIKPRLDELKTKEELKSQEKKFANDIANHRIQEVNNKQELLQYLEQLKNLTTHSDGFTDYVNSIL